MQSINYKVWNHDTQRLGDMVCADWGVAGEENLLVTCHVKYSEDEVIKLYPSWDYSSRVELLQVVDMMKDSKGNKLYSGCIVEGPAVKFGCVHTIKIAIIFTGIEWLACPIDGKEYDGMCFSLRNMDSSNKEIVGNIYENFDLIENEEHIISKLPEHTVKEIKRRRGKPNA